LPLAIVAPGYSMAVIPWLTCFWVLTLWHIFMVALWNRADPYIFALWYLLSFYLSIFFSGLISAVAHWLSAILPDMVWP